jgi:hypothetical protein
MSSVAARRLAEPLKWDEPSGDHLRGLAVQLSDGCPSCGSRDAIIGKGKGPCHAALFCTRCAKTSWLGTKPSPRLRHRSCQEIWQANHTNQNSTQAKRRRAKVNSVPKANELKPRNTGESYMPGNNQADGFSVAEKTGNNLIVGKMLKFTVDSNYKVDKADDLPDGTTLVAINVTTAWVKWLGEKPTEHRITRPGQVHPDRDDLPDQDKATWGSGLNGQPADPWRDTRYLRLIDPRTGQDYTFVTDTYGGRKAVGDLKSQIGNVRFAYPGALPVVELGSTMMKTSFGLKPRPQFKVVDWRNKNNATVQLTHGPQNKPPEQNLSEIEPPFNDQIPDFNEEFTPWE